MIDEQRDVAAALAHGRNRDPNHRQPIIEIFAKVLFPDLGAQVAVGRSDHPDVDFFVRVRSHFAHRALVEYAQQRRLQIERHLADLVEEDGAAVSLGEGSSAIGDSARERAFDVSEKGALDQLARHRAAVEYDKRPVAARGVIVNLLGDQLLAGAGLALDQHRGVGVGHILEQIEHLPHLGVCADELSE